MTPNSVEPVHVARAAALPRLLGQAVAAGLLALYAVVLNHVACWSAMFLAALFAWPLWVARVEVKLFERRALLEHLTWEDSQVRRWLWAGRLTQMVQAVVSLALGLLLLVLAAQLKAEHWALLAADVLLLSLLVEPIRSRIASQVRRGSEAVAARRWPLFAINLSFLTLAFAAIDYFLTGAPDTRGMHLEEAVGHVFKTVSDGVACKPLGWFMGALAAGEASSWHSAQQLIPALPSADLKPAAWAIFLLHGGAVAYLFTRFQLGVIALVDQRLSDQKGKEGGVVTRVFVYTILLLAILFQYASYRLDDFKPPPLGGPDPIDPCGPAEDAAKSLHEWLSDELMQARDQARDVGASKIDAEVEALFEVMEAGVDGYLDWYFTVIGEYERLGAAVTGTFAEFMEEHLQQYLFVKTEFHERLDRGMASILANSATTFETAVGGIIDSAEIKLVQSRCPVRAIDRHVRDRLVEFDVSRERLNAATASVGGAVTSLVIGKVMAKKSVQGAVALGAKAIAKKGGSAILSGIGAAALCSPGGVVAVVCGVGAAVLTWIGVDKLLVEIDEARLRPAMREEILGVLNEQKEVLARDLRMAHADVVNQLARQIERNLKRVFIPNEH